MSENASSPIEQLSAAEWQKTPESVKHLTKTLVVGIEQLERQCEELKAENQLLREQVNQNSQNSSKPPSGDVGKGFKSKAHRKGGKKRGGQPGHEGHERFLYPIEACQTVDEYHPVGCWCWGGALHKDDPQAHRVQIVE